MVEGSTDSDKTKILDLDMILAGFPDNNIDKMLLARGWRDKEAHIAAKLVRYCNQNTQFSEDGSSDYGVHLLVAKLIESKCKKPMQKWQEKIDKKLSPFLVERAMKGREPYDRVAFKAKLLPHKGNISWDAVAVHFLRLEAGVYY